MFFLLTGSRESRRKTLTPGKRFMFTVNVLFQSDVWWCLVFEDALADGFWVISVLAAVGYANKLRVPIATKGSQGISMSLWAVRDPEHLLCEAQTQSCGLCRAVTLTGDMSPFLCGEMCPQDGTLGADGRGSVMASTFSVRRMQRRGGCQGGERAEEFPTHLEAIAHTSYKSTTGTCILLSTLTRCLSSFTRLQIKYANTAT